jgi:hypothetical protein
MANLGQPDRQVEIDLTASPLESKPGPRGHGQGITASLNLSFIGKLLRLGLRIDDKSAHVAGSVIFTVAAIGATIPTLVVLLVCAVAHAPTMVTIGASLGTMAIFTAIAFGLLKLGRRQPVVGRERAQQYVERAGLQRTGPKKYKRSKSANKRKGNRPKNRR